VNREANVEMSNPTIILFGSWLGIFKNCSYRKEFFS